MLVRTLDSVLGTSRDVDWGNGTSRRLLVAADERPYTVTDTYVRPGTSTFLRYDNHLESCYCIEGSGYVETAEGRHELAPGTLYAPGKGEEHTLVSAEGMRLVCVFSPALTGDESHEHVPGQPSGY